AAAGTWVLFATYRSIGQRSERGILARALMALRGAGLCALLLALAKPTWTRENELVDAGHVAIVVDNSLSRSLADPSGKSRYALAKGAVDQLRISLRSRANGPQVEVDLFDIHGAPLADLPEPPRIERTDLVRAL